MLQYYFLLLVVRDSGTKIVEIWLTNEGFLFFFFYLFLCCEEGGQIFETMEAMEIKHYMICRDLPVINSTYIS